MGMSSKVNGSTIRLMAMESICMRMEPGMRDIGKMICKMATEWRLGLMGLSTRATIKKAKNMVKEPTLGMMAQPMRESGLTIRLTVG